MCTQGAHYHTLYQELKRVAKGFLLFSGHGLFFHFSPNNENGIKYLPFSTTGTIGEGGATSSGIITQSVDSSSLSRMGAGQSPDSPITASVPLLSINCGRGSGSCEASDWLRDSSSAACSSLSYNRSSIVLERMHAAAYTYKLWHCNRYIISDHMKTEVFL